ncbi:hypothetical protein E2C01_016003 [Portunus trituberculatus]|uniref:Uncharacterized protein n=1 Tax=Portunus trituberculatus TaxID=210409 RepID=A0A5B7DMY2_PORTR|nr:hypothetical protein [Portunus trituberculatus]
MVYDAHTNSHRVHVVRRVEWRCGASTASERAWCGRKPFRLTAPGHRSVSSTPTRITAIKNFVQP